MRFEPLEGRCLLSALPALDARLGDFVASELRQQVARPLAVAADVTGLTQVRSEYGLTGAGQTVAVIDTGIAYDHAALGGGLGSSYHVVGGYDFAEGDANPYDDGPAGGHGTHVAGILAGSSAYYAGVAPGVDVVSLRVFDDAGHSQFDWIEQALRWVHTNRNAFAYPITTVNLSLGAAWNSSTLPGWAVLEDELAQLEADGIFIAVAAGNGFQSSGQTGLSYPAASAHVVPVASVDADGTLSYFSQRDPRVIAAPGRSISSTVPDYLGDRNGVADDYAQLSGTSMAAPYVAGASVLLREAYQYAGVANVSQQALYQKLVNTADTISDPITGRNYFRLNLDRAVDSVMPADDFGSTAATAATLGTITDKRSVKGAIERLQDQDWFTFTAGASGTVSIAVAPDGNLAPKWQLPSGVKTIVDASGRVLSFSVTAGQSYTFGLATSKGLGHYTLDVAIKANAGTTNWGTVQQGRFNGYQVTAAGAWFNLTAAADGILTIEALSSRGSGSTQLQLYDAGGRLVAASTATADGARIDFTATAGAAFRLRAVAVGGATNVDFRVTDLVAKVGNSLRVTGTEANDNLVFHAGKNYVLSINGVSYQFAKAAIASLLFDGRGGSDAAVFESDDNCSATLRPGSAEIVGSGYQAKATSVETLTVRSSGAANRAMLYDSAGNDALVAGPTYASLSGSSFANRVEGFQTVYAYATAGKNTAQLYDSAGNDTLVLSVQDARLSGRGFYIRAAGFAEVSAYATAGGYDTGRFQTLAGSTAPAVSASRLGVKSILDTAAVDRALQLQGTWR
jgi:hypothetical protein